MISAWAVGSFVGMGLLKPLADHDRAVSNDDGANRHFAGRFGFSSLRQSHFHDSVRHDSRVHASMLHLFYT